MKKSFITLIFLLAVQFSLTAQSKEIYELRVYHCLPNRLDALVNRFANHTLALFEKHGMKNVGYWLPTAEGNKDLVYILSYPSMEAREASWKAFMNDPEWQDVWKKSEADGKIIEKIDASFLKLEPQLTKKIKQKASKEEQLFELRTYYCLAGRYPNIVARFRDHTRKLFETHGMKNIAYWETIEKDGKQPLLVYIVSHKDAEAAKKSWDNFRNDPKWIAARDASEADAKIVEKITSVMMKPLPFSKIR